MVGGPTTNPNERATVALAVFGDFPLALLDSLTRLLAPEMAHAQLTLRVSQPTMALRVWADNERTDPHTLLVAALDVQKGDSWRLVLVDAARGRALVRELPGGVARDRAALEAVGSMVASAAHALQEGLELASRSVDDALSEAATPTRHEVSPAPAISPPPTVANRVRARGAAGLSVASFERSAPISYGVGVELAVLIEHFGIQLTLARYRPRLNTNAGSFDIDRTAIAMATVARREWGALAGEVGIGAAGELLQRDGAVANGAAAATPMLGGSNLVRCGPLLELAGRLRLASHLSLSMGSGWSYFPQRIRYLESGPNSTTMTTLASPWPVVAFGRIALEVLLP